MATCQVGFDRKNRAVIAYQKFDETGNTHFTSRALKMGRGKNTKPREQPWPEPEMLQVVVLP